MALRFLRSLVAGAPSTGDGEGLNLEAAAPDALQAANAMAAAGTAGVRSGAEPLRRDTVEVHLAVKVLGAHLANRYQTSYPLTLNLGSLSADEGAALMRLLADGLAAEGPPDAARRERAREQLVRLNATDAQIDALGMALAEPRPLNALVDEVRALDKAPHAYALMLVCGVGRGTVGAAYLGYLALRLGLSRETVGSLSRRFRG